jgi:hypothetical protein
LAISLLDEARCPAIEFGALYQRHWRIEEALKHIRHRLHLEAVTGLTHLALQQDLAAKIVADNLARSAHHHPTSRRRALDHAGQRPQPHLLDRHAILAPVTRERVHGFAHPSH